MLKSESPPLVVGPVGEYHAVFVIAVVVYGTDFPEHVVLRVELRRGYPATSVVNAGDGVGLAAHIIVAAYVRLGGDVSVGGIADVVGSVAAISDAGEAVEIVVGECLIAVGHACSPRHVTSGGVVGERHRSYGHAIDIRKPLVCHSPCQVVDGGGL